MDKSIEKASILIEALPYFQEFRDKIVVIKFGGSVMENPTLIQNTMRDIVFMECIGMKPVVVHGGGKAITAKLKEEHVATQFINGLRFTCEKTLLIVDDILHNKVNNNLLEGIKEAGGKGEQMSGKKIIIAEKMKKCPKTGEEKDFGFVGEVIEVNTEPIQKMLDEDTLPIIPPLGLDNDGQLYNINADIAACKIAESLNAKKLIFISDVPGLLKDANDETTLITSLNINEVQHLIEEGIIGTGMIPKIKSAISALNAGVNKVHLIDGRIQHSLLLEIFTNKGIGTEIIK